MANIYEVRSSSGDVVATGFESRQAAKVIRDQLTGTKTKHKHIVSRGSDHPRGRSGEAA